MWIASHLDGSRRRTGRCAVDSLGLLATGEEGHVGLSKDALVALSFSRRSPETARSCEAELGHQTHRERLTQQALDGTLRARIDTTCHSTFVLAKVCEPAKVIDEGMQSSQSLRDEER